MVTEGGIVSEPVAGTTPVDEITVVISPSYSENERDIVVEVSDADAEGEWFRIIGAEPDICYKNFTAPNVTPPISMVMLAVKSSWSKRVEFLKEALEKSLCG